MAEAPGGSGTCLQLSRVHRSDPVISEGLSCPATGVLRQWENQLSCDSGSCPVGWPGPCSLVFAHLGFEHNLLLSLAPSCRVRTQSTAGG